MVKMVPLISTRCTGPLGLVHLPRVWQKMLLASRDQLADGYRSGEGGFDGFVLDVDDRGNRFNPNKLLIDPYAKALHRDHDWGRASLASGPARTAVTYGASSKSVLVQSNYTWSAEEAQWRAARHQGGSDGNGGDVPQLH